MHLWYIIWILYINAETKYNSRIQISTQLTVTCWVPVVESHCSLEWHKNQSSEITMDLRTHFLIFWPLIRLGLHKLASRSYDWKFWSLNVGHRQTHPLVHCCTVRFSVLTLMFSNLSVHPLGDPGAMKTLGLGLRGSEFTLPITDSLNWINDIWKVAKYFWILISISIKQKCCCLFYLVLFLIINS